MTRFVSTVLSALLIVVACGPRNEWDDIDYSGVHHAYGGRQNDTSYKQPNVIACINEDLYNCK